VLLALALILTLPRTSVAPGLASGFDTQARVRTTLLMLLMMPLLVINGLSFFWSGYLNITGRYGVPAVVSSVTPAVVLLMVVSDFGSRASIVLALGTLVGGIAELFLLLVLSRKAGAVLFARPNFARPDWTGMVSQYLPAVAAAVLTAMTAVVDQTFAASLAEGSVSILSYGTRLAAVAASLMIVTVSAVALPVFTVSVAEGQWTKVWDTLIVGCAATFLIGALIALVVSLRSEAIVAAFFGGGRFSQESIELAAAVQAAYIWHLPFYAAAMVILRALLAMSMSTVVLLGSVANLVTDVLANILLVPVLGVVGIGYATTLMYAFGFVFLGSLAMSEVRTRRASEIRK
jgi:putative peptidoglycan lipid II flippase